MSNFKLFISDIYDINNENFKEMMKLIKDPNPLNEKYTERHHIIPRFIYRDKHLEIDNSESNMVRLSIKNHILVHYYAAKCCKSQFKWKCLNSILRTLGNIKLSDFENNLYEISEQLAETKRLLKIVPKPVSSRKGTHLSIESKLKISKNRTGKGIGHVTSVETRQKIGNANRGRIYGFDKTIRSRVGNFNSYRLSKLKTKFTGKTTDEWNVYQKKVKLLQNKIIQEIQEKTNEAKKKIRINYKEEILNEILKRLD